MIQTVSGTHADATLRLHQHHQRSGDDQRKADGGLLIPHFARTDVSPANSADPNAKSTHITVAFLSCCVFTRKPQKIGRCVIRLYFYCSSIASNAMLTPNVCANVVPCAAKFLLSCGHNNRIPLRLPGVKQQIASPLLRRCNLFVLF